MNYGIGFSRGGTRCGLSSRGWPSQRLMQSGAVQYKQAAWLPNQGGCEEEEEPFVCRVGLESMHRLEGEEEKPVH